jgi:RTX calcium-binding nonapeptide repeat (4 copies)
MGRSISFGCAAALTCLVLASVAVGVSRNGGAGADTLQGTSNADTLKGGGGPDKLIGGPGDDVLIGGKGDDTIKGGSGYDSFNMKNGVEKPSPGNDVIKARDHNPDAINCGAGVDVAIVDGVEDGVYYCETVKEPGQ